jgi:predicted nucleotidyltransferase
MNTQIFSEIQALKRQILPNEKVILFGSQARGDAREDSDWDLLVLTNKEKSSFNEDYDIYAYPFAELGMKYGTMITAIVRAKKEWDSRPSLLKYNIEREGVEIV